MERIEPITHSGRVSPATTLASVKRYILIVPHGTERGLKMPKSTIKCSLYEGKGVRILKRVITTRKGKFEVFDIEMKNLVIIKDCRLVHGKHGDFISTPSKEVDGDYYPQAYIAPKIADMLIEILTEEDFKKTSLKYLSFNDDEDDEDEDEDDEDDEDKDEDEDEDENASNRKRRRR